MLAFITDKEFEQAALDKVATMIVEKASQFISTGNVADIAEQCLTYLEQIAVDRQLQPIVISTYLEIVAGENDQIREFFND